MRKIVFRIKDIDIWYYGFPLRKVRPEDLYISFQGEDENGNSFYSISVDVKTLGQFTGLCDKNGKEIHEGDIILTQPIKTKPYSKNTKTKKRVGKVVWNSGKRDGSSVITEPSFIVEFIDKENDYRCWNWSLFYDCEVIGNIHDNPELLKGE